MHNLSLSPRWLARAMLAVGALALSVPAFAGISYKLSRTQAAPGETVSITAVVFNDTGSALTWNAPPQLIIQWRGPNGQATRSMAYISEGQGSFTVPVNNFVQISWNAVVPSDVHGLQAVNVEGDSTLLALDASAPGNGMVAAAPAIGPVVDAGKAGGNGTPDPELPASLVLAAGASPQAGPAPAASARPDESPSAFDNFRSAIQPYEPVYFAYGDNGKRNARFQVSLKYQLFRPKDPAKPEFKDHFYLAYTQTSLWDLESDSSPFVDTSFKPSFFWRKDALWESPSKQWFVGLQTGVEHESNGKDGDDTRSLNHYYLQPELNYRFGDGSTLTFGPRVKAYFSMDENPDYADYMGHVDWRLRWAQDNGLVLSGLYRHGDGGRYATQVEAAWPLQRTPLKMNGYLYAQFRKGYGETLLEYDRKTGSQVRVGLALVP